MAGDWMKIEKVTPDKPEVLEIAGMVGIHHDEVFGKLYRLWSWADDQTEDGNAHGVTLALLDSRIGVTGFAKAMQVVGWLELIEPCEDYPRGGVRFNNFDRHNGETAKKRALTAIRVAKCKNLGNAKGNAASVTDALPREEKRREEIKTSTSVVGVVGLEETSPIVVHESDRPELAEDFARIVSIVGVAKSPAQKAKDRELFFKAAVLSRHSLGSDWLEDALQSAGDKIRAGDINNKRALFFGICRQLAADRGKYFERELKRVQVPRWVNERK